MSRLRHNSGFTLVEVLVSIPIMVVVLLATLTVFDRFNSNASTARKQNDALDVSRVTIDQITKQLRNLANPTTGSSTIGSAADYSFAFQTSDPSRTWVRYCLQGGTAATGGTVWLATA